MMENEARGPMPNVDPTLQPGEVLLRVKSASHPSCEDLEFNAQSSFSVRQIKETIQRLSAHHPEIKEQRLIYSGHLLDDNQLLKDVLTANSGSLTPHQAVTIHLAWNSKSLFNSTPASARIGGQKAGNDGLPGENGIPPQPLFNNQQGFGGGNLGMAQGPGGIPQDVLSLHQLYVEQMTAYVNNWYMYQGAMGGMFYQYPQPPVGAGNFIPPAAPQFQPQNNNAVPPNRAQADNIAAARAGDEDENQRDLLDWMYTLSRVVLVFSVVYFYSSFSRFLLVVVFTALVMILQRRNGQANQNAEGVVPPARHPGAQPNQPPQQPQPQPNRERNENAAAEGEELDGQRENPADGLERTPTAENRDENTGDQNNVAEEDGSQVVAEPLPPQANMREVALTFLTTFFTSLIPETYQNN